MYVSASPSSESASPGRANDPLAVMHRIFEEGFATGNTAVVDEVCSPDLIEHQFGLAGVGAEALEHVKAAIADLHSAFPDIRFALEDSVVEGEMVWVRARAQGTVSGPFFGPPSGRPFDITVFDQARVVDGRIVEHWGVPDRFATMAQTGILARISNAAR